MARKWTTISPRVCPLPAQRAARRPAPRAARVLRRGPPSHGAGDRHAGPGADAPAPGPKRLTPSTSPLRHLDTAQRLDVIRRAQVWTATTIGCCQCHSHKYDPFSQKEYYQLLAILNNTTDNNGGDEPA